MPSLQTSLKTYILEDFLDSFSQDSSDSMYLFIARPSSWPGGGDEDAPDHVESTEKFFDTWRRMISVKRITDKDVYLMASKNEWTSGTKYDEYTDTAKLLGLSYYVTNSESNVYKCISNNGGVGSTDSPRGAHQESITTSDGYIWKFLFRIPDSYSRFITDSLIPIRKLKIENGVSDKFDDERQLQYSVQYNAVNGSIERIKVATVGDEYPKSVPYRPDTHSDGPTKVVLASNNTITLASNESTDDDYYNNYAITITSGSGVGQTRLISDYVGSTQKATLSENWGTNPDTSSYYQIAPSVAVDGDGSGAAGTSSVDSDLKVDKITVTNNGSGYTRATATISTANAGSDATLGVVISPYGGHGSDPAEELGATACMILARLERREEDIFPVINDYRQYGIIKNPIIHSGYTGAGRIAGSEVDTLNDVKLDAATGSNFSQNSFVSGDMMFGVESQTCGEVETWNRNTDFAKGTVRLKNVRGDFKINEKVISVEDTGSDTWTSSGRQAGYVSFQENTISSQTNNNYRLTTKLIVSPTGGSSLDTFIDSSWTEDMGVTGASGSSSTLVSWTNSGAVGGTAELLVTNLIGSSGAGGYGFTAGESLVGTSHTTYINSVEPPQFVMGSGKLIHVNNIEPIERHNEQTEELRLIISLP